jgi:putative ABC transport system permease protein
MGQNIRYTLRSLLRSPSFSIAALLCLALGIGATSVIFSIVNAVVLRPLPYRQPDQLTRIYSEFPDFPNGGLRRFWVSEPEVFDLKAAKSYQAIGAYATGGVNLSTTTDPIHVTAAAVNAEGLSTLGIAPEKGRLFTTEEDKPGVPPVILLSHSLWQRAYAGDPDILNKDVFLGGVKCRVIGIMPKGFIFPPGETDAAEAWAPLQLNPASKNRGGHNYNVFGRLKDGVSVEQARQEMAGLVAHWGEADSPMNHVFSTAHHPVVMYDFYDETVRGVRKAMLLLLGAVIFVLLIACVNVANLLLARSEGRQREIAVRRALGASTGQLLEQFAVEGIVLSLVGALLGLILAFGGLRLILNTGAASIPRADEVALDWRVLLFTLVVSIVSGVVFGLAPLVQVSALQLFDTLKAASGRSSSTNSSNQFRRVLVVVEMAMAFVLLAGAGLMVRGFWRLQQVNVGFNPHGVLTARVELPESSYKTDALQQQFWQRLTTQLNQTPGVAAASLASGLPPSRSPNENDTDIEGFVKVPHGPIQSVNFYQTVTPQYFETIGARLMEGRWFDQHDGPARSVIVNQTMANTFWPHKSAVGHRVKPGTKEWYTVVGVVADLKNAGADRPTGTELFVPYNNTENIGGTESPYILVRTKGDPAQLANAVREAVRSLDPTLPVAKVRVMEDVVAAASSRPRFLTLILGLFSVLALVLAAVGIYGVISYSVAQRTTEFGIKIALGAEPGMLLRQVLQQGMLLAAAGMVAGTVVAFFLTQFLEGLIFGVSGFDMTSLGATVAVLALATLAACYVPAARAMHTEPIQALRYE